ncbi:MAG: hypothetical protein JW829_06705 [Pirellulales bacterium]|nr:hypothetical protein [Pirellulales bacterium]
MRAMPKTFVFGLISFFLALLMGCHGSVEYIDEMEMLPVKEELIEFSLGHHVIPIPATLPGDGIEWAHGNSLCLTFDLCAIIDPKHEKYVHSQWEHAEGIFRNDVNEVCRQARLDELTDEPDLITLRGRLTEIATRRLGKDRIRRLVLNGINLQPL